ncbi:MAG: ATP synthase subunit delta [Parcubacteria group bacterium GW2011_GWF1_40_5]|nr:MAG: ATP synthase subunit delta [Parcubacteria group bacterium GW2011_GWF1_40_5]
MSTISNNDIAKAIYLASKDKSSTEMHQVHKKVVEFLTRKKFMSRVAVILEQLKKVINFENGIVSATVLSAHRVHEKEEKDLVHFLKKRYSAKEVELTYILDQSLIRGIRLEVNDEVIDLTVRNQINQLKEDLIRPA